MWKMISASQERVTALLAWAFVQIWKWLSLWVDALEKVLPLGRGRSRKTGFGKRGIAHLCKKNKPLPLWQVVRRAEFRPVFGSWPILLTAPQWCISLRAVWRQGHVHGSTQRAPHDCDPCGWCVRELEREKAGRREERKEGGVEESLKKQVRLIMGLCRTQENRTLHQSPEIIC